MADNYIAELFHYVLQEGSVFNVIESFILMMVMMMMIRMVRKVIVVVIDDDKKYLS